VYVGIVSDESAKSYKRPPIMTMEERIKAVEGCKYVDKVIADSPVTITKEFIDLHKIDLIFTPDNRTEDEIKLMLEVPYEMGIVRKVPYTNTISTTDIIKRISKRINE
jgi:glycerol-3-phosphate cytidylyltransferase-like family protein